LYFYGAFIYSKHDYNLVSAYTGWLENVDKFCMRFGGELIWQHCTVSCKVTFNLKARARKRTLLIAKPPPTIPKGACQKFQDGGDSCWVFLRVRWILRFKISTQGYLSELFLFMRFSSRIVAAVQENFTKNRI